MFAEKRPDRYRAVELTEELVEQLALFLVSTTQSPEDLVANSCFEHACQRECDSLIELLCTSDNVDDRQVWQHICKLLIKVGAKVEDRIRNSINCILPGYLVLAHIEYPGFLSPNMSLGKSIKKYRSRAGLKQKELADLLGVSPNYMSLVENDKREPSLSFVMNLADQLQVPIGFLFFDADQNVEHLPREAALLFQKIKDLMYQIDILMPRNNA